MTTIMRHIHRILIATAFASSLATAEPGRVIVPASEEFPRNGKGSMLALKGGSILQLYGQIHLASRQIEIFNINKWTNVGLHHMTLLHPLLPGPIRETGAGGQEREFLGASQSPVRRGWRSSTETMNR